MTDSKTMQDILKSFHNATTNTKPKDIRMGDYKLSVEEYEIAPNTYKSYYNIYNLKESNEELYSLALFESAMVIIKELSMGVNQKKEKIARLDSQYDDYLQEAAVIKAKAKLVTESFKRDVYSAKHDHAVHKMKSIKQQIKAAI